MYNKKRYLPQGMEENQHIIIIPQTPYAIAGDRKKAMLAKCTDYISKAINAEALFNLIANSF